MPWTMRCLLCDTRERWTDLVSLQEHAMREYGYSLYDLRNQSRRPASANKDHYIWKMPDGKDWLEAKKEGESSEGVPKQPAPPVPALRADDAATLPAYVRRNPRLRSTS